jgi:hypothetical protein
LNIINAKGPELTKAQEKFVKMGGVNPTLEPTGGSCSMRYLHGFDAKSGYIPYGKLDASQQEYANDKYFGYCAYEESRVPTYGGTGDPEDLRKALKKAEEITKNCGIAFASINNRQHNLAPWMATEFVRAGWKDMGWCRAGNNKHAIRLFVWMNPYYDIPGKTANPSYDGDSYNPVPDAPI